MKCSFCGFVFSQNEGINACQGCPVSNCSLIKCPNCGYDQLPEPQSLKWIKKMFKKNKKMMTHKETQKTLYLSDLKRKEKGIVKKLNTNDETKTQKLLAMGILPGKSIYVIQSWPVMVIQVESAQMALDNALAGAIVMLK